MFTCDAAELRQFVTDNFLFGEPLTLGDTDSFLAAGIIDSTGVLQLIEHLEERYQIKVDNEDVVPENLDSILNLKAFIERKRLANNHLTA